MKVALLITTFNRPVYLKRCFDSILKADRSQLTTIMIVDDASTDKDVDKLIDSQPYERYMIFKPENKGIKHSLLVGYEELFKSHDVVINLDSDAIITPNCFTELIRLKTKYPDRIITGFHSTTKNKDGTERHYILEEWTDVYVKKSVGGINMIVSRLDYEQHVKPSLLTNLNWDHRTSISAEKAGKPVLSVKWSLVDHIGFVSAMGHNHDKPDIAHNFKTHYLKDVTLFGLDSRDPHSLKEAARISQSNIEFGDVKLFNQPYIASKSDYSVWMMSQLYAHIKTSHVLIIQADGFVVNADAWDDQWLRYDYIGSPWAYCSGRRVGNGGFSLRSRRLMEIVATDPHIVPLRQPHNEILEDHCICRVYGDYLEKEHGIKFAPVEVADKFGIEAYGVSMQGANEWNGHFGFHGLKVSWARKEGYKPYPEKNPWKVINYDI